MTVNAAGEVLVIAERFGLDSRTRYKFPGACGSVVAAVGRACASSLLPS